MTSSTAATCPTCPGLPILTPYGPDNSWLCAHCNGRFLPKDECYALVVERMGVSVAEIGQLLARPGQMKLACPGCGNTSSEVTIRGVPVQLCSTCGGMWMSAGKEFAPGKAPSRPVGVSRTAPDPKAKRTVGTPVRSTTSWGGTLALVGLMLAAGGGGFFFLTKREKPVAEKPKDPDADLNLGSEAYDVYELGGRNMVWWRTYLKDLKADQSESGKQRYAVALVRARALRMEVTETAEGVTVRPSRDLARAILKRQGAQL